LQVATSKWTFVDPSGRLHDAASQREDRDEQGKDNVSIVFGEMAFTQLCRITISSLL